MDLDRNLAKLTVDLCRVAYLDPDAAGAAVVDLGGTDFVFDTALSTQSITSIHGDHVVLAFRGSEAIADWLANANFLPSAREAGVKVHSGFSDALDEVWSDIEARLDPAASVVVSGHSLGAALACLAAWRLHRSGRNVHAVYGYGQPRTGHSDFRSAYESVLGDRTFRFINHIDLITRVPLLIQGYRHVGRRMYFDGEGRFHPDASGWAIVRDDVKYRLAHLGRVDSVGIGPHLIGPYQRLVDRL